MIGPAATARAAMLDPDRFAALLCDYCLEPAPGDQVVVRATTLATPLLLAVQRALLARGAWPLLRPELGGETAQLLALARDEQLDGFAPADLAEAEGTSHELRIQAPFNTRELAAVDPERIARLTRARAPVRTAARQRRWCVTIWPTDALAQQAGMSLAELTAFLERALLLDRPDPVAAWRALGERQQALVERLSSAQSIRIEAPGTDLTLSVAGRTWINSDGRRNMPSGEVFTGPVEQSAHGEITFTIPSAPGGLDVRDVRLMFRAGEVVEAHAGSGQDYLRATLATDAGARFLGELGIGTNFGIDRPIGAILVDEKIGGTVHLAVGASYPETGGVNESAVHWDMICDLRSGGRLSVDGELLLEDGVFA